MLVELSVVEQRLLAVLEVVRDGLTVTEVAGRYGVSRQSVHNWLRRYATGGLQGLEDRSHRPHGCPHQTPAEVEARLIELRRRFPEWGPVRLAYQLAKDGVDPLPGRTSIYRALVRNQLVTARPRRRRRGDYRRWERQRPMELWQLDVMGGVLLANGTELKLVSGIDDHSRYCVAAGLVARATGRAVCGVFTAAMRRYGVPEEVLTDNGKQFTGRFGAHYGEVLFDRICREHGVAHRLTRPRSPTTGKVERLHRTLRRGFLAGRTFASLEQAQAALDGFVAAYNTARPHQALGMVPPAQRFQPGQPLPVQAVRAGEALALTPSIPRSFPPAPGWTADGHRVKAVLDYGRGPEKTWVYGALRVRDGQTVTLAAPSRNSVGYQQLLAAVEAANPAGAIAVVTDNLSSHSSVSTRAWLVDHPRIQHAFIPKAACWLNLQEGWWRLFRREALAGQSFATPGEISLATRVATCQLNARARPWVWGRPPPSARYRRRTLIYRI